MYIYAMHMYNIYYICVFMGIYIVHIYVYIYIYMANTPFFP